MKNFICEGKRIQVTLTAAVSAGSPVVVGSMVGIAQDSGAKGDVIVVALNGVYEVFKAAEAITQGEKLYYSTANSNFTGTADGNTFAGYAFATATAADSTVQIKFPL